MSASDFTNGLNERMNFEANENNLYNDQIRQEKKKEDAARDEKDTMDNIETDAIMGGTGLLGGKELYDNVKKYGGKYNKFRAAGKSKLGSIGGILGEEYDEVSEAGRKIKSGISGTQKVLKAGYDGVKNFTGHKFTRDIMNSAGLVKNPVNGGAKQIIDTSKIDVGNIKDSRDATGGVDISDKATTGYNWNKSGILDRQPKAGAVSRTLNFDPPRQPAMKVRSVRRNISLSATQDEPAKAVDIPKSTALTRTPVISRTKFEQPENPGDWLNRFRPEGKNKSLTNFGDLDPDTMNHAIQRRTVKAIPAFSSKPTPAKGMPRSGGEEEAISHMNNSDLVQIKNPASGEMRNLTRTGKAIPTTMAAKISQPVPKPVWAARPGGLTGIQQQQPIKAQEPILSQAPSNTRVSGGAVKDVKDVENDPVFSWSKSMEGEPGGILGIKPKIGGASSIINTTNVKPSSGILERGTEAAEGAAKEAAGGISGMINKIGESGAGRVLGKAAFVAPGALDLYDDIKGKGIQGKNMWDKIANVGTMAGSALALVPGADILGGAIDVGSAIVGEVGDEKDKISEAASTAKADAAPADTVRAPVQGSVGSTGGFLTNKGPAQQISMGGSF